MIRKIIFVIFALTITSNCGKKSTPQYPGGQEIPDFSKNYDDGNV